MSRVADRYRPTQLLAGSRVSPVRVVIPLLVAGFIGLLWGASDVHLWVLRQEGMVGQEAIAWVTGGLDETSRRLGIFTARDNIERGLQPIKEPFHVFTVGEPPPPPLPEPTEEPVEEDDWKWVGPTDPDGTRVSRLLIVGASSIQYYLGTELEREVEARYAGLTVKRLGKLGTGLVRDDVFDWREKIKALLKTHRPQVVIVQLAGNDAQGMMKDRKPLKFGTEAWKTAYAERLIEVVESIHAAKAQAVFVGMPIMRSPGFSKRMALINTLTHDTVTAEGGVFIPTWDLSSDDKGAYLAMVEIDGSRGKMRLPDGIHYSKMGARHVARGVLRRLERSVPVVLKAADEDEPPLSAVAMHGLERVAFVPQTVPEEGLSGRVIRCPTNADYWSWMDVAADWVRAEGGSDWVTVLECHPDPESRSSRWLEREGDMRLPVTEWEIDVAYDEGRLVEMTALVTKPDAPEPEVE